MATPPSSESNHPVTLRDIGKALGVSHSTVSLALRNHPRISEATRKKVQKVAEEMGYRPDPMLGALAKYRRGRTDQPINASLAWINAWADPEHLREHKEFDSYWKGAQETADKFGYRLEEFRVGGGLDPQRLHQILSARGIRGMLLPPHFEQPDWGDFPWDQYSLVRFGRSLRSPVTHVVTADQVGNTMLAFKSMWERGYRRIGFVAHDFELKHDQKLFELGFYGGQLLVEEAERLPSLLLGDAGSKESKERLGRWLKEHRPDGIFTTLPEMRGMLNAAGVKVPKDIGLAASTLIDTNVDAGIDQHPEEIGRAGFLMLNSLINDGSRGIPEIFRQVLVEGSWVEGKDLPRRG